MKYTSDDIDLVKKHHLGDMGRIQYIIESLYSGKDLPESDESYFNEVVKRSKLQEINQNNKFVETVDFQESEKFVDSTNVINNEINSFDNLENNTKSNSENPSKNDSVFETIDPVKQDHYEKELNEKHSLYDSTRKEYEIVTKKGSESAFTISELEREKHENEQKILKTNDELDNLEKLKQYTDEQTRKLIKSSHDNKKSRSSKIDKEQSSLKIVENSTKKTQSNLNKKINSLKSSKNILQQLLNSRKKKKEIKTQIDLEKNLIDKSKTILEKQKHLEKFDSKIKSVSNSNDDVITELHTMQQKRNNIHKKISDIFDQIDDKINDEQHSIENSKKEHQMLVEHQKQENKRIDEKINEFGQQQIEHNKKLDNIQKEIDFMNDSRRSYEDLIIENKKTQKELEDKVQTRKLELESIEIKKNTAEMELSTAKARMEKAQELYDKELQKNKKLTEDIEFKIRSEQEIQESLLKEIQKTLNEKKHIDEEIESEKNKIIQQEKEIKKISQHKKTFEKSKEDFEDLLGFVSKKQNMLKSLQSRRLDMEKNMNQKSKRMQEDEIKHKDYLKKLKDILDDL
ncbi:hypothetical protein [Nitrosopumilus sp. Nsub]|uniref:hypothetical protein n=1 Tax=Nitrosopumilus sp. Nsub TaxID=1776294 RepID=UPI00082F7388|nr:hypothetical protein [Nitrosopumilus sp. Nsub]